MPPTSFLEMPSELAPSGAAQRAMDALATCENLLAELAPPPKHEPDRQLERLQSEVDSLRHEVTHLRRRDETLGLYMQRTDEEMRLAARLQQDFLPKSLPQLGRVHFHTLYRPANYVSGDLYDVMRLTERHVGFYMADAVGHGVPAALLAMFIKNALVTKDIHSQTLGAPKEVAVGYRLLDPGQSLERLNTALVEQNLQHATFATAVYGHIDTQTLEVRLSRAGHPHPVVLRANGGMDVIESDGSLLGIFENEPFESRAFQLAVGDKLVIYTDGVEVAFNPEDSADGKLDTMRWLQELRARASLGGEQIVRELAEHLNAESGSLMPKDDLTMIIAEVK